MSRLATGGRLARHLLAGLVVVLAVASAGCGGGESTGPAWLRDVPASEAPAPGTRVWALVPVEVDRVPSDDADETGDDTDSVLAGPARLELGTLAEPTVEESEVVDDGSAVLVDALGRRSIVPAALVRPTLWTEPREALMAGTPWLVSRDGRPTIARQTEGGRLAIDHNGVTVTLDPARVDATPLVNVDSLDGAAEASLPVRVVYDDGGTPRVGLAMAWSDEWVWLLDDGGFGRRVARSGVEAAWPALLPSTEMVSAETVRAYDWVDGVRSGRVVEVVEPALRARVALDGDASESRVYWFADLLR